MRPSSSSTSLHLLLRQYNYSGGGVKGIPLALLAELLLRLALLAAFVALEYWTPFQRVIHKEEAWLYANPRTDSYLPTSTLWPMVTLVPVTTVAAALAVRRDAADAFVAMLVATLLVPLNG